MEIMKITERNALQICIHFFLKLPKILPKKQPKNTLFCTLFCNALIIKENNFKNLQ